MKQQLWRLIGTLGIAAIAIGLALLLMPTPAKSIAFNPSNEPLKFSPSSSTSSDNLLVNPDFEAGYSRSLPCCNNIAVPNGWNIRWYTDTAAVIDGITYTYKQPEVKLDDNTKWPFCDGCAPNVPPRIHSGRYAVDAFVLYATQDTTVYQQVGNIPLGAVVTGSAWLHAWVSSCNPFPQQGKFQRPALSLLGPNDSNNDEECPINFWPINANHMLVGIDPFGGTDPRASTVIWNWDESNPPWWGPYDYYSSTVPVTAVARAYTVTLFLRGVTRIPTRFDDIYFDTASLTYDFPIEWRIDQDRPWPLSTSITIGLQTPVTLTDISALLQGPIGQLAPIDFVGGDGISPAITATWRFTPEMPGRYTISIGAHELPFSLTHALEVTALPFRYEQDHLLTPGVVSGTTLITYVLSSPIELTNFTSIISDVAGMPLSTTVVYSQFVDPLYDYGWEFDASTAGFYTATLQADEFTFPFQKSIFVSATRVYLPIVFRNG